MRLIDADKLVFDYSGIRYIAPNDSIEIAKYFADQINSAPTITPESLLQHGKWEEGTFLWWQICSCCNWNLPFALGSDEAKFCPHCGAKMDLDRMKGDADD